MLDRTPEADATREIILGTRERVQLWRNAVAEAKPRNCDRYLQYGIPGPGGADYLGIVRSGPCRGTWIAVEIKRADGKGRASEKQHHFLDAVRALGGIGVVAVCAADVHAAIDAAEQARLTPPSPPAYSSETTAPATLERPGAMAHRKAIR